MPRVRLISTALAFLITGASTTTITAQAPAAIAAAIPWHASSIGKSSPAARDEFYQGLRDLDAERFIAARAHFDNAVVADPNFAIGQLYAAFNGASLADYKTHLDAAVGALDGATPAEQAPAHQVYYSFSGELGSWVNIPGLSGGTAGVKSNLVALAATWTNGAPLYVVWLDDNATGGVDRGYSIDDISFAPTTGLGLEVIPDKVVDVLSVLLFRARITESNGPGTQFTYSLDAGAPETARINPANGLFHWRPAKTDAGTTNSITIRATENSSMLSTTQKFTVAVREYAEVTIGSAVVEVGQQTNVLIQSDSSIPLTNISFAVLFPTNRLVNLVLANPVPPIASIDFDVSQPDRMLITIATIPGQFLTGPQQLTGLGFTAASPQSSAFIPLQLRDVIGLQAEPGLAPTVLENDGRVVAVNGEPLLESFQNGSARSLTLYGKPGTNYQLETSSNLGASWQPWQSVTLSNLFQSVDASAHTNAPVILYRAFNGVAAPASLLPPSPTEFKALTKLNKRKMAAALKRQKRLHSRLPSPDLIP